MTLDVTRGKLGRFGRRPTMGSGITALAIGEPDANIFNCPACSRPLDTGASRCPGCGTRLIAGVRLGRALAFVGTGLVVGMVVGGSLTAALGMARRPAEGVALVPAPAVPSQAPVATAAVPVTDPGIPTSALSALRQSTTLNQRIVSDAERLAQAVSVPGVSGNEIAPVLRNLAANASFGAGVAPEVAEWDAGSSVSAGLVSFYDSIGLIAREGLAASLSNRSAYVSAANRVLEAVAGLGALDAAARVLAADAEVELPVVFSEPQAAS